MSADAFQLFEPMRTFLSTESLHHFVQTHHAEIVALQKTAFLKNALQVLAEKKVLSVPVLDEDGEYFGCISVGDVMRALQQELDTVLGHNWFERIDNIIKLGKSDLETVGANLGAKRVSSITHPGDLWLKGDSKTTVLTVIKEGFQVLEPKVHHRIFVVDPAKAHTVTVHDSTVVINIKPGTEKPEASGLRPTDIVSQMDVVKLLVEHKDKLELVNAKTLEELQIFEGSVFTINAAKSALEAFRHMAVDHKSCLGIVNDSGKLIGNVSLSDLRMLSTDNYALLTASVAEFVVVVSGNGPSATEVINGARVPGAAEGDWEKVLSAIPLTSLKPSSTFGQLMDTITTQGLHRCYITDDEGKPVSIVTLTDVLREIIKPAPKGGQFHRLGSNLPETTEDETEEDDESEADA